MGREGDGIVIAGFIRTKRNGDERTGEDNDGILNTWTGVSGGCFLMDADRGCPRFPLWRSCKLETYGTMILFPKHLFRAHIGGLYDLSGILMAVMFRVRHPGSENPDHFGIFVGRKSFLLSHILSK
jgi:hypothetical protein